MYSLGVTLYAAADHNLPAAAEPALSPALEAVLAGMAVEDPCVRTRLPSSSLFF